MWLMTDFLPKAQVQAFQFPLHISYFLQKCKKGKPSKKNLPYLKTISQPIETLPKLRTHSRNHKVSSCCDMVLRYHKKIRPLIAFFHCRYLRSIKRSSLLLTFDKFFPVKLLTSDNHLCHKMSFQLSSPGSLHDTKRQGILF